MTAFNEAYSRIVCELDVPIPLVTQRRHLPLGYVQERQAEKMAKCLDRGFLEASIDGFHIVATVRQATRSSAPVLMAPNKLLRILRVVMGFIGPASFGERIISNLRMAQ